MEKVYESKEYKEVQKQRSTIWTTPGLSTAQKLKKMAELNRKEYDMFAVALSSPEHIEVDGRSLNDKLKDFLTDPRLRHARFTGLMDRLNFENTFLEVNKLTDEDPDTVTEGSLRNQLGNLTLSKTRMLADPDVQARLAYFETITTTAGDLIDEFEKSLVDPAVFPDKATSIQARLDAINKIQWALYEIYSEELD